MTSCDDCNADCPPLSFSLFVALLGHTGRIPSVQAVLLMFIIPEEYFLK